MLKVYTGENRCLSAELIARVGEAMAQCDADLFIIVPRQLTLLTERTLIREMHLRGSFRLRVMSPARLCGLIFQAGCAWMIAGGRCWCAPRCAMYRIN